MRFTLTQLFMGAAFVAICCLMLTTDGCQLTMAKIDSLEFTPDDTRILVTQRELHGVGQLPDPSEQNEAYSPVYSRTVSWQAAADGRLLSVIQHDLASGNRESAPAFWPSSVAYCRALDSVAVGALGGGDLTWCDGSGNVTRLGIQGGAVVLAASPSGKLLAARGYEEWMVYDTVERVVKLQVPSMWMDFPGLPLMAWTSDELQILVVSDNGLAAWDLASSQRTPIPLEGWDSRLTAIETTPQGQLIVCSQDWVRKYDQRGRKLATLADFGVNQCSVARNGTRAALLDDDQWIILDLETNRPLLHRSLPGATAMAISSEGDRVALGDDHGWVTVFDANSGTELWSANSAGRYRLSWTVPAGLLIVWSSVAGLLTRRKMVRVRQQRGIGLPGVSNPP